MNALARTAVAESFPQEKFRALSWGELVEHLSAAWDDWHKKAALNDPASLEREPTEHETAIYQAAQSALDSALDQIRSFQPTDFDLLGRKSALLSGHPAFARFGDADDAEVFEVLSRDAERLGAVFEAGKFWQPSAELRALAADADTAWLAYGEATKLTDAVALGREPSPDEEAAYVKASEAHQAALRALVAYAPKDLGEFVQKAGALKYNFPCDEPAMLDRLVADAERLQSRAWASPDFRGLELALDRRFAEMRRIESSGTDAELSEAVYGVAALAEEISNLAPRCLDDFRIKARAVEADDPGLANLLSLIGPNSTTRATLEPLLRQLLALPVAATNPDEALIRQCLAYAAHLRGMGLESNEQASAAAPQAAAEQTYFSICAMTPFGIQAKAAALKARLEWDVDADGVFDPLADLANRMAWNLVQNHEALASGASTRSVPSIVPMVSELTHANNTHVEIPGVWGVKDWDDAVSRYNAACRASEAEHLAYHKSHAALCDLAPPDLLELKPWGTFERWPDMATFDRDAGVLNEDRARLRPMLAQWLANRPAIEAQVGLYAGDARSDNLYDLRHEAQDSLLATPAPDAAALAYKQRIVAWESDEEKSGFDDLGWIAFTKCASQMGLGLVASHMDTLRLGGLDHPALYAEEFDPAVWRTDFCEMGCEIGAGRNDELIVVFPCTGGTEVMERANAAIAVISATAWKKRAVLLWAQELRERGCDPFLTEFLEPRQRGAAQ